MRAEKRSTGCAPFTDCRRSLSDKRQENGVSGNYHLEPCPPLPHPPAGTLARAGSCRPPTAGGRLTAVLGQSSTQPKRAYHPTLHRAQLRLGHPSRGRASWWRDISTLESAPFGTEAALLVVRYARRSGPQPGSRWRRECHIADKNEAAAAGHRGSVCAGRPSGCLSAESVCGPSNLQLDPTIAVSINNVLEWESPCLVPGMNVPRPLPIPANSVGRGHRQSVGFGCGLRALLAEFEGPSSLGISVPNYLRNRGKTGRVG